MSQWHMGSTYITDNGMGNGTSDIAIFLMTSEKLSKKVLVSQA
jgi:hypothetical protein